MEKNAILLELSVKLFLEKFGIVVDNNVEIDIVDDEIAHVNVYNTEFKVTMKSNYDIEKKFAELVETDWDYTIRDIVIVESVEYVIYVERDKVLEVVA